MMGLINYPPALHDKNGHFWFLRHAYRNCADPRRRRHFALAVCQESGGGKSWLSMSIAEAIFPDFKPEDSIAFTPERFAEIANERHPICFPLILDDAGLSAFSGDALTRQVKSISKIMQSIRSKRWCVILNLPNLELLAKSVRLTNQYYCEPVGINYGDGITYAKFQRIKNSPFTGKIIRRNMRKRWVIINPNTNAPHSIPLCYPTITIPAPSPAHVSTYERMKEDAMNKFRGDTSKEMIIEKEKLTKGKQSLTMKISEAIRAEPSKYVRDKKVDFDKVVADFPCGHTTAYYIMNELRLRHPDIVDGYFKTNERGKKHSPRPEPTKEETAQGELSNTELDNIAKAEKAARNPRK